MTKVLPVAPLMAVRSQVADSWIDDGVKEFTPDTADVYLGNLPADNIQRMAPRKDRSRVERMKRSMLRGAWQVNPSSRILLGKNGVLLDGRGRLTAVKESGVTIWSHVSRSPDRVDATGLVVDQAVARESSYILQQPVRLVRAANVAFFLVKNRTPDFEEITPFTDQFYGVYQALELDNKRGFGTSASIQLAAMLSVISRRASIQYISGILGLFSRRDPRDLPPLPYSLYRQCAAENLGQRGQLLRAFRAFEERKQSVQKIQIKDEPGVADEIRHLLRVAVEEWR